MAVSMVSEKGWTMLSRPGFTTLVGWILAFWAGAINTTDIGLALARGNPTG
jgi:hypothetical protein